jgi:predicted metal-binding protein
MARKVAPGISRGMRPEEFQADLERYCQLAVERGAEAKVLPAKDIVIDERVPQKCQSPRCSSYGTCANCPPHYEPHLDDVRKLFGKYQYAIVFRIPVDPKLMCGRRDEEQQKAFATITQACQDLVLDIESAAFYDGYYLAFGFGGGACKHTRCASVECAALAPGGKCRFPLKARASGEALGVDFYQTAIRCGWDVYPIGKSSDPASIPGKGNRIGMVLID